MPTNILSFDASDARDYLHAASIRPASRKTYKRLVYPTLSERQLGAHRVHRNLSAYAKLMSLVLLGYLVIGVAGGIGFAQNHMLGRHRGHLVCELHGHVVVGNGKFHECYEPGVGSDLAR